VGEGSFDPDLLRGEAGERIIITLTPLVAPLQASLSHEGRGLLFLLPAGGGFLLLFFEAARDTVLRFLDTLPPGSGIDERVRIARLACLQFFEAFEYRAVGIIRTRIPAVVRQIDIDPRNGGHALCAFHGLFETAHAIASAKPAGIERLMRR